MKKVPLFVKDAVFDLLNKVSIPLSKSMIGWQLSLSYYYVNKSLKELIEENKIRCIKVSPTREKYVIS